MIELILLVSGLMSAQAQTITYGDLMIEDSVERGWGKGRAALVGGYDVTNPYLNTYVYGLQVSGELNANVRMEVENIRFQSSASRYNSRLENELKLFGVEAGHDHPMQLTTLKGTVHLLAGRVNMFGLKAMPFRFDARLGLGAMWMTDRSTSAAATWGFGPEIKVSEHIILALAFDQDVQSVFAGPKKVYRNRLGLSLGYCWW